MLTLLHISDLHFGPTYQAAVGEALLAAAEKLQPTVIVASGDFTQRAKSSQFAAARAFLDRLPPAPRVVVPGNHDVPLYRIFERLFAPYAQYRKHIASESDAVLKRDDAVIVSLNTTSPLTKITEGTIRRRQIDFCAQAFRDAPAGAVKVVVAHHHFAPAPDYDHRHNAMAQGRLALDAFGEMEVDLILGGHLHRAYIGNSLDVYPGEHRRRGVIIVQSGTSTSGRGRARERQKNSFNLIQVSQDVVRIVHYMYFHEQQGFAALSRHEFPRRPHSHLVGFEPPA